MDRLKNAIDLKNEGKIKEAEALFHTLILENHNTDKCYYHLALIEVAKGNTTEAKKHYAKAIDVNPQYFKAINNLGLLHMADNNNEEAIFFFEKALEISPNEITPSINLAIALTRIGKFQQAYDLLYKFEIEGLTNEAKESILDALGTAQLHLKKFDQAYESFKAVAEKLNPNNFTALTQLAFIALEILKDYNTANVWVDKALAINPNFTPALQNKGLIMKALGNYEEAVKYLQRVIDLNPGNFEGYYNIACAYAALGNTDAVRTNLEKSSQLAPFIKDHVKQDRDFLNYRREAWFQELFN